MATAGHEIQEKYEKSLYRKNYYNLVSHIEEKINTCVCALCNVHWTILFSNRGIQKSTN